ncbi:hypothetical protein EDD17DRAFT_1510347 [Pisolithus thermaeus]|nr:hypothetical protein EDD17DRAFT_1510347 [Pisolithus thermaeus]
MAKRVVHCFIPYTFLGYNETYPLLFHDCSGEKGHALERLWGLDSTPFICYKGLGFATQLNSLVGNWRWFKGRCLLYLPHSSLWTVNSTAPNSSRIGDWSSHWYSSHKIWSRELKRFIHTPSFWEALTFMVVKGQEMHMPPLLTFTELAEDTLQTLLDTCQTVVEELAHWKRFSIRICTLVHPPPHLVLQHLQLVLYI